MPKSFACAIVHGDPPEVFALAAFELQFTPLFRD